MYIERTKKGTVKNMKSYKIYQKTSEKFENCMYFDNTKGESLDNYNRVKFQDAHYDKISDLESFKNVKMNEFFVLK